MDYSTSQTVGLSRPQKGLDFWNSIAPVLGLFFLAPLTAEYLIGYSSETFTEMLVGLLLLAPTYGGAAIIIRESARRTGRGWPTIILLSLAFGIFMAGLIDHSLFDPSFQITELWHDMPNPTYIPALGISYLDALYFVLGHVIWSISAPIAIIETFVPRSRTVPWLGNLGLAIISLLYILASSILCWGIAIDDQFFPSALQMAGTAIVVMALIALAFSVRLEERPFAAIRLPKPWVVGTAAFMLLSLPNIIETGCEMLGIPSMFMIDWPGFIINILTVGLLAALTWRWSQSRDWSASHTLSLAGGALLTRVWIAFLLVPFDEAMFYDELVQRTVFLLGVVMLLLLAAWKIRADKKRYEAWV